MLLQRGRVLSLDCNGFFPGGDFSGLLTVHDASGKEVSKISRVESGRFRKKIKLSRVGTGRARRFSNAIGGFGSPGPDPTPRM